MSKPFRKIMFRSTQNYVSVRMSSDTHLLLKSIFAKQLCRCLYIAIYITLPYIVYIMEAYLYATSKMCLINTLWTWYPQWLLMDYVLYLHWSLWLWSNKIWPSQLTIFAAYRPELEHHFYQITDYLHKVPLVVRFDMWIVS